MTSPRDWSYLIGKTCSFDGPDGKTRLVGVIRAAVDAGFTTRGNIPDAVVDIRGSSGKVMTVSLVESHLQLNETS